MKKYVVRTPQTDRQQLDVPTLLTDLDDYVAPTLPCSGHAAMPASTVAIANGVPNSVASFTFSELVNCDVDGGESLLPTTDGLFLLVLKVLWEDRTPFAGIQLCHADVTVNAVTVGTISVSTIDATWSGAGSFVRRLASGDLVGVSFTNGFLGGEDNDVTFELDIVKLAA